LWDLKSKKHLAHLSTAFSWSVRFHPDGQRLIACGMDGVQLLALPHPVCREAVSEQYVTWPSEFSRLSLDSTGDTLAVVDWNQQAILVFPSCQLETPLILRGHKAVREVAVSPDGRWLATATWHGKGVRIWDAQTGAYVQDLLPESGAALLVFSPDGRWLMVGTGAEYQMFSVDGWLPGRSFTRTQGGNIPGPAAFSADSRVVALCPTTDTIRLICVDSGIELATLAAPERDILTWLRFSPDGKHLIAGTENNVIQLWDLAELNSALEPFKLNWQ
jgi:WD40 repeat protein